ncbi:hypothetical protein LY28_01315 [Ruminiclostridium sufflavum DSM 19573]|uniref:Uncharacterized protein n=1 Tax=Ruminiclostridium sufflavum DSM 19573 TaxID=1121337 RepID=A0A318XNQ5_9FIRM|nr:hypothetical protein [Ruminiclostridium sufflavum]PYG88466.1 hypothetical protein LY28_01315 [Ruminiclostridium sufflavum DSM 19573]
MTYLNGEIDCYCYMVLRGKPAAVLPVKKECVRGVKDRIINFHRLKAFEKELSEEWSSIWIYDKDFMLEIINCLPEKPNTIFEHWVLGKVFGFSDEAIEKFIRNYTL